MYIDHRGKRSAELTRHPTSYRPLILDDLEGEESMSYIQLNLTDKERERYFEGRGENDENAMETDETIKGVSQILQSIEGWQGDIQDVCQDK